MSLTQINKAGLDEIALDHVFTIGASGSSAYTFQGEGLNGTVNNPTLYLTRGKTYRFENGSGGHPIRIQSTSGASGTAYNTGVTNNAGSGTVIVEVQHDAPDVLYYQCTSHAAMNGILYITGALADGGVTTAKLASSSVTAVKIASGNVDNTALGTNAVSTVKIQDDAVTDAKLANSINAAIAANTAKTSNATHTGDVTGSTSLHITNDAVTTTKIADLNVTTGKLANGAVTSPKLGANAVTTGELADTAVTTAKIAADAVTGAKIADDAVGNEHLANNCVNTVQIANSQVTTGKIADQAVTLDKLPHGTSSNDGKFLRANNGADPTFESISTDLDGLTDVTVSTAYPLQTSNPPSGVGHVWINKSTGDVYVCTDATSNENQWRNVGDRSGGINEKTPIQSHDNTWFYSRFDESASVSGNNIVNLATGSSALNVTIPKDSGSRTASSGSTTMQFSSETQAVRHNFTNADPLSPSTHGLTCGALFKKSSASGGNGVIYYGDTGTDNHFFWRTDFSNNNTIYVGEDTGSSDIWTEAITGVNDNEWIFAVISVDTNGTLRASRDGGSFSVVRSSGTAPTPSDAHFGIQGDMYNDNAANHEFAAFFFYKGIMTDAQVLSEYNYLKSIWSIT